MWKTSPYQKASIQGISPVKVFLKFTGDHTETEKMKKYRDKISNLPNKYVYAYYLLTLHTLP